ncbi:uncharacterized protein LOC116344820 isoform X2 [Contarinia nasturtii]|uniref:uncharacterized protein LOC116344820 isoform X2 n=1 Tax=Contarinia nasturtii TaxID=265458 RepID=UPI0012D4650F|nr:uncharacterized protein LOC116344820 isoform X2 [Contarinia nasturtii]
MRCNDAMTPLVIILKIESKNWEELRELYLPETPETILGLGIISNYLRWIQRDASIANLTFYSLNGDWSDGTFVVVDRYHVYFDSLSETKERLTTLLDLLDYTNGFRIMHVRSKHYPVMLEIIKKKHLLLEYDDSNLLYYLPKHQATALYTELPENFESRSLSQEDVIKANDEWPFNHAGSLFYLQRLAQFNPCCGVFTTDGKLVSYGFQYQSGTIGNLYTDPAYRNRGFGSSIAKTIFKQTGEHGGAIATVKRTNAASRAIFEKIGCQVIDEVHWIAIPCRWTEEDDMTLSDGSN